MSLSTLSNQGHVVCVCVCVCVCVWLLFCACVLPIVFFNTPESPILRAAGIAFGAGIGAGRAYTQAQFGFVHPELIPQEVSVPFPAALAPGTSHLTAFMGVVPPLLVSRFGVLLLRALKLCTALFLSLFSVLQGHVCLVPV